MGKVDKYIDEAKKNVEDVKNNMDEMADDAQGFFAKYKVWVIAAGVVIAVVIIGALII